MPTIERVITTDAGPRPVWRFLSDFTTTEQWDPSTRSTVRERGDGGVGTVYHNVSSVLGREIEIEYTVIELSLPGSGSPYRLRVRGSTTTMRLMDSITVERDGTGAKVTYRAEFHAQGDEDLTRSLMAWGLKRVGSRGAQQLQRCLGGLGRRDAPTTSGVGAGGR